MRATQHSECRWLSIDRVLECSPNIDVAAARRKKPDSLISQPTIRLKKMQTIARRLRSSNQRNYYIITKFFKCIRV